MYCQNCGVQLSEKAKFCPNCGEKIETSYATRDEISPEYHSKMNSKYESSTIEDFDDFEDRFNLIPATKSFETNLTRDSEVLSILKTDKFNLELESKIFDYDSVIFLINISTEVKNLEMDIDEGRKIAFKLGKYIFNFKERNIHPSLHNEFDKNLKIQIYVVFNEKIIYNLGGEKKMTNNDISNSETKSTANNLSIFEWTMEGGQIDMDSVEEPQTQEALEKVKQLLSEGDYDNALKSMPTLHFEFSGNNLDSDPSEFFTEDLELDFEIDLKNENHKISLDIYDDQLLVTISVIFPLPLKAGVDTDEINEWLDDNGGYFAGVAYGGWGWGGDEGGQLICIS